MTKKTLTTAILAILVAAGAAVLAAVYGMSGQERNQVAASACNGSRDLAARLEGLNTGQLAAFQIADDPGYVGDITFADHAEKKTGLADHRGQTVLLNLWATWCAPCREEMPALAALQQTMGGEMFQVLPVSMDVGNADKPKKFYAENNLAELPFRHDGTLATFNTLKKMSIALGMPATVLVDGRGCALGWINGPADWSSSDARALVSAVLEGENGG